MIFMLRYRGYNVYITEDDEYVACLKSNKAVKFLRNCITSIKEEIDARLDGWE